MDKSNYKILVVDDEEDIRDLLVHLLEKEGFQTKVSSNGNEGLKIALNWLPHLILLDVMMPEMDGIETCREIRNKKEIKNTIIAFLTARNEDYSQIAGFDSGADDYISKPIRPRLLLSKIESLLRRLDKSHGITIESQASSLKIDREKFLIEIDGKQLILPKKEFELLELLASRPGKVFNREQILSIVWGNETIVGERTIDVHIRKLREKLGDEYIRTIKGVGYTFNEK
jgi:two-component system alkaline phosphatase synthesis response regulator PhoP